MATARENKLTGSTGEFLVAAELCRKDLHATPFAGNVPYYDIIATGQFGGYVAVQVKTINGVSWPITIKNFVDVHMAPDGVHQIVGEGKPEPFPDLMCVFVVLSQEPGGHDRFFIMEWKELQKIVVNSYAENLRKHGGKRPRTVTTFHHAEWIASFEQFEDSWGKILSRVNPSPNRTPPATKPNGSMS